MAKSQLLMLAKATFRTLAAYITMPNTKVVPSIHSVLPTIPRSPCFPSQEYFQEVYISVHKIPWLRAKVESWGAPPFYINLRPWLGPKKSKISLITCSITWKTSFNMLHKGRRWKSGSTQAPNSIMLKIKLISKRKKLKQHRSKIPESIRSSRT